MTRHEHVEGKPTPPDAITRDHLIPRRYDGPTVTENLIAACLQCNVIRGELDAFAFYNLQQKWFRRDRTLRDRWHQLSRSEIQHFKTWCRQVHVRQLNGLARHHPEHAFRHHELTTELEQWRSRQQLHALAR